ncbi:MAG: hypothetical protein EOP52_13700 [Sphingobacteriales bacterium]|nr:MAG: hypothetical protein EOP52_13700 [Sphingobacteriales bacterium]
MFLKYKRVRLDGDLLNGKRAIADIKFTDGCNLILTNSNTQGKSSVINALAVGLGFDDLVKGNVAALMTDKIKINGTDMPIAKASIYLEIENEEGKVLSIKREVKPELSKGMRVNFAPLTEWSEENAEELYLGSGSYANSKGFHKLLTEFVGFPDIQVVSQNDGTMRLYLEYIFAAIFIEQKRGWADIMANSPYYQVRDPKKSTISEILGLDYIRNNLQRNTLKLSLERINANYDNALGLLIHQIHARNYSLKGIPEDISSDIWFPKVFMAFEGQTEISLVDVIKHKTSELDNKQGLAYVPELDANAEARLNITSQEISRLITQKTEANYTLSNMEGAIRRYQQRQKVLTVDLDKNKEEQKLKRLFAHDRWVIKCQCPVCERPIDETLLSQLKNFPAMSLEENVKYISDQKSLLESVLEVEQEQKKVLEREIAHMTSKLNELFEDQSNIQRSLTGYIPSEYMAQAREIALLEQQVKDLTALQDLSDMAIQKLKQLFDDYHSKLKVFKNLKSGLSDSDEALVHKFQQAFRSYLVKLGYNSYEIKSIIIDEVSFSPRVIITNMDQRKQMRADFGSSASDWIRIITAYTLALHACRRNSRNSEHPNVSVFDEPAQQNMDKEDYLKFFDIVADVCSNGGQVIIAATDKDHAVREKARLLEMNIIDFGPQYILQELPTP